MDDSRLGRALTARIPLIATRSEDPSSIGRVMEFLTDGGASQVFNATRTEGIRPGAIVWTLETPGAPLKTYTQMIEKRASLVLVNGEPNEMYLDVGEMPVPEGLLYEELVEQRFSAEDARRMLAALGGATLKEVRWILSLTGRSTSPAALMEARRRLLPDQRGLIPVDPAVDFYWPDDELAAWAQREKHFVNGPARLRPRGLLLSGSPGVGKTGGAKYLAREFGLPLYRLDIGGAKDKFVGVSEQMLRAALDKIDRVSPCIVLIDEVEKVLTQTDHDAGATSAMMDALLWWLEQRASGAVVVMTTNAKWRIPPELYRGNRIDREMELKGIPAHQGREFVRGLLASYGEIGDKIDIGEWTFDGWTPQALLAEMVRDELKEVLYERRDAG